MLVVAVLLAYLAGSIPFGVVVGRVRGVDLRGHGSGNIGATNAARVLGPRLGLLVLLCDVAKGFFPVWLSARLLPDQPWGLVTVGAAAVLGHLYPLWLGFRGGKGVATALGVFLALAPAATLLAGAVFLVVYRIWRLSSLGSLAAATALQPLLWLLHEPVAVRALAALVWLLILARHRSNIVRLWHRTEMKV